MVFKGLDLWLWGSATSAPAATVYYEGRSHLATISGTLAQQPALQTAAAAVFSAAATRHFIIACVKACEALLFHCVHGLVMMAVALCGRAFALSTPGSCDCRLQHQHDV
jgi:hypothetical protein